VLKLKNVFSVSALLVFIFLSMPKAFCADADTAPAGAEERRFREEKMQENLERYTGQKKKPASAPIEAETPEPEAEGATVSFVLKTLEFSGNEEISSEQLRSVVQSAIGQTVTLKDLQLIAKEIKEYYRGRGYIAAYVYLPPQNVKSGTVRLNVAEGKLGAVEIEGNRWYSNKALTRELNLKPGEVVRVAPLQSSLTRLNDQPDIKARAVLKPGAEPATTNIVLKVKDRIPVHLSTDVNNLGTDNTGKHRWGVEAKHNNLLGQMDQLSGRVQLGKGVWAVGSDYSVPIRPIRTRVGFAYTRASVDVGGPFRALGVKGSAATYSVYGNTELGFWRSVKATLNTGFDWKSVENKILGNVSGRDELRVLNLGVTLEQSDRWGRTIFPNSVHIGFSNFLGASDNIDAGASRAQTGGQFVVYRNSLIRYQRLPLGMMFSFRGNTQLTPDRLASSEQLRLGGAFSVRGYPEGEYLSDYGGYTNYELLVPSYFFPKDWKLPWASAPLRQQIQGVGFFDMGAGGLRKPLPGEDNSKFLAGAGGGVRLQLYDRIYGRFQWAGRLGDRASDGTTSAFYYGISTEVL